MENNENCIEATVCSHNGCCPFGFVFGRVWAAKPQGTAERNRLLAVRFLHLRKTLDGTAQCRLQKNQFLSPLPRSRPLMCPIGMGFQFWKNWKNVPMSMSIIRWFLNRALRKKFNVMLAGNELPDAFLSSDFTPAQLVSNGKNGIFLNIKDLLAENTPNFNKC